MQGHAAPAGWQTMESAPRDGTPVLVCYKDGEIAIRCWMPKHGGWASPDSEGLFTYGDQHLSRWMPLPARPSTDPVSTG